MHKISILTSTPIGGLIHTNTLRRRVKRILKQPLISQNIPSLVEVCITLTDDQEIHKLNRDYRGYDKPTDVLSFALSEGESMWTPPGEPIALGDIIISIDTAKKQALRGALPRLTPWINHGRKWSVSDEVSFLMLHGLLHLIGYDHETDEDAVEMETLEHQLLASLLGLPQRA